MANERLTTRDKLFSTFLLVAGVVMLLIAPAANAAKTELGVVGIVLFFTGILTMTRKQRN